MFLTIEKILELFEKFLECLKRFLKEGKGCETFEPLEDVQIARNDFRTFKKVLGNVFEGMRILSNVRNVFGTFQTFENVRNVRKDFYTFKKKVFGTFKKGSF